MITKLQRLAALLTRPTDHHDTHVHFHQGPQGQPAACHDAGCDVPRLTL